MSNFEYDLSQSQDKVIEQELHESYKKIFRGRRIQVNTDLQEQKKGIDKIIITKENDTIRIEEKIRSGKYNDILLELKSNIELDRPGWLLKDGQKTDYIVYKTQSMILNLHYTTLKLIYLNKRAEWEYKASKGIGGFRFVEAKTTDKNGKIIYHSLNIAIPLNEYWKAQREFIFNQL